MIDEHDLVSSKTIGIVGVKNPSASWASGDSGSAWLTNDVSCLATGNGKIPRDLVATWTFETFLQLGH